MRHVSKRGAFTLIELLVVITIIVVLLALLTPALNEAVYQAQLATCGTRLKGLGLGIVQYALDSGRRYPRSASTARHHTVLNNWDYDGRPALKPYVSLNGHLNCPLTQEMDIEGSIYDGGAAPLRGVSSAYALWYGWQYMRPEASDPAAAQMPSEKGMNRLGDRFTWTDANGYVHSFSLLASDFNDDMSGGANFVQGTHPDRDGLMQQVFAQDSSPPWAPAGQALTLSWWERPKSDERGLIDRNFSRADGSVLRVANQPWGPGSPGRGPGDDRMVTAPVFSHSADWTAGRKTYLPRE